MSKGTFRKKPFRKSQKPTPRPFKVKYYGVVHTVLALTARHAREVVAAMNPVTVVRDKYNHVENVEAPWRGGKRFEAQAKTNLAELEAAKTAYADAVATHEANLEAGDTVGDPDAYAETVQTSKLHVDETKEALDAAKTLVRHDKHAIVDLCKKQKRANKAAVEAINTAVAALA